MATSDPQKAIAEMFSSLTVYRNIGLDSEGRSHHYDPDANEIVVCETDRRTRGVRDDDVTERIDPPEWSTGTWDYIEYVRDQVEGVEWAETNAPTEPPEGR